MSIPLKPEHLAQLKIFVDLCMANPTILNRPELSFIKSFVEYFGGKVPKDEPSCKKPESANVSKESEAETKPETATEPDVESEESDLELDMSDVIEPDTDTPQKMGNPTLQPTEEEIAESQAKRAEAVSAFVEKDYERALQLYTEAILLNPQASLLYAKRGQIYLLLNKPNACIRDCNRALELNPDSAAAHKFRGRAYHLLGKFEEAANDLRLACKFDFDEQADEWLRAVTPNARKIEEHKRKKERKMQEKLEREKQRIKNAQESTKAFKENFRTFQTDTTGSAPAGMPDFSKFLDDDEIVQSLTEPEIAEFCKEISSNPASILKYQRNPKIMAFINKMASKFGVVGGMPPGFPGMPGGMPNFPSTDGAATPPPPPPPPPTTEQSDVGLD